MTASKVKDATFGKMGIRSKDFGRGTDSMGKQLFGKRVNQAAYNFLMEKLQFDN